MGMAASADPETRREWPAAWLPPGPIAWRDVGPSDLSYENSASNENWWWGPGRVDGEEARIWFRRSDGLWEEMFVVKPSAIKEAGTGLFAARALKNKQRLMYYTGTDLGAVGAPDGEAASDGARRYSMGGRYIMEVKGRYVMGRMCKRGGPRRDGAPAWPEAAELYDCYTERRGNPAFLVNDLGSQLNNARVNGEGVMVVGPTNHTKSCNIKEGDEISYYYGEEYWRYWGHRRVGSKPGTARGKRRREEQAASGGDEDGDGGGTGGQSTRRRSPRLAGGGEPAGGDARGRGAGPRSEAGQRVGSTRMGRGDDGEYCEGASDGGGESDAEGDGGRGGESWRERAAAAWRVQRGNVARERRASDDRGIT